MFWGGFWGSGAGWIFGLVTLGLFVLAVAAGAILLQREFAHPHPMWRRPPPALRILEERYARGEISREDFFERRAVLVASMRPPQQPPQPSPPSYPAPPAQDPPGPTTSVGDSAGPPTYTGPAPQLDTGPPTDASKPEDPTQPLPPSAPSS